jgi:hypothetical protein
VTEGPRRSISAFPIARDPAQLHYLENDDFTLIRSLHMTVRKSVYKATPDLFLTGESQPAFKINTLNPLRVSTKKNLCDNTRAPHSILEDEQGGIYFGGFKASEKADFSEVF